MATKRLRTSNAAGPRMPEALGQSAAFLAFQEQISRVARIERPVLIVGERGTGKELAARRLHYLSGRWNEPLVTLNCAALAPTLIESELFGHEAGAFTGAVARRAGRFEAADGGTLFLDEIADIPLEVQEKILRVVEYGVFERVGSVTSVRVDVRIIGATNADLAALTAQERFKRDLLDRLSFEVLYVPPLRERTGDILLLANHFAARMAFEMGWEAVPELSDQTAEALQGYDWPGNVRELKNAVERAVYRSKSSTITEVEFDPFRPPPGVRPSHSVRQCGPASEGAQPVHPPSLDKPFSEAVRDLEVGLLRRVLEETRHNQRRAAELLGLTYHQFRGLYRKHKDLL